MATTCWSNVERHDDPEEAPPCVGQWCCGCSRHPVGKPWGWNEPAWTEHFQQAHDGRSEP